MSKAAQLAALIGSGQAQGNKNLIINGAMQVAQRGTSHTTSVSTGYHTVDRIKIAGSSNIGQWTSSQDSDAPSGFTKSFKLDCTTADTSLSANDHYGFQYMPEGFHMDSVGKGTSGAKSMTLSFYVKATVTKTMVVEFTDASNSRHVNFAVTPSTTNTWERVSLSIPADTSGSFNQGTNSSAGEINFWLGAGTTYTSGSLQSAWTSRVAANIMAGVSNWADSTSNAIWIAGLQLEIGDVATPFEHESYATTLQKCQRYYTVGGQKDSSGSGSTTSSTTRYGVTMRAAPALSFGNSTQGAGTVLPAGTDWISATEFSAYVSSASINFSYTANAEL
jgi:hypothetical protein